MISFACAWVIVVAIKTKTEFSNAGTYILIAAISDCFIAYQIAHWSFK